MRNLIFIAALAASTAALAQTTSDPNAAGNMDHMSTQQPTDTGNDSGAASGAMSGQGMTADQGTTTTGQAAAAGQSGMSGQGSMDQQSMGQAPMQGQGGMSQGGMAGGMTGGQTVAPGNQAPERDARGIAVVSDPAMAPPGTNNMTTGATMMAGGQGSAFQSQPSSEEYPTCSRTVTDNCVQAYERGRGARRR